MAHTPLEDMEDGGDWEALDLADFELVEAKQGQPDMQ